MSDLNANPEQDAALALWRDVDGLSSSVAVDWDDGGDPAYSVRIRTEFLTGDDPTSIAQTARRHGARLSFDGCDVVLVIA